MEGCCPHYGLVLRVHYWPFLAPGKNLPLTQTEASVLGQLWGWGGMGLQLGQKATTIIHAIVLILSELPYSYYLQEKI